MSDPIDFVAFQEALLGRYSLDREIGRGGMGVVYLAHEVALDRPVALKVMPPSFAAQPALRERFLREARTAAKLSHPNIVPIFAVDEVDDFVFFAMSYVQGPTLGELVRDRGSLKPKDAVRVLQEVAWALEHAHGDGVVHRDVKPDNILIEDGSGRALVTDFGIAQLRSEPGMTGAQEILGTAEYMSPEQASGEDVGPASDIYSLGVVGFYATTGKLPFEGSTVAAVLAKHLTQRAPPLASVAPEMPAALANTIDRCLKKAPEERFESGGALAEALGTGMQLQKELPVPLRIFVRSMRDAAASTPLVFLLWVVIALIPILAGDDVSAWPAVVFLTLGGVAAAPMILLAAYARRLLGAGYTLEDGRLALREDMLHRLEEIKFDFGKGLTWVDKLLRVTAGAGFLIVLVSIGSGLLGQELSKTGIFGWNLGVLSSFAIGFRNKRRLDWIGSVATKVLDSIVGRWSFQLGGVGLRTGAIAAGGAHRPTEMAISIAADRLFDELPKELKRELKGLPDVIARLEGDAASMRDHLDQLEAVLSEIGDGTDRGGAEERVALKADVERTRDEAKRRMTAAISALEKIRLGLLRLHAGDGTVESLTMELGSARDLSAAIDRLLQGQKDVARMLRPPELRTDP